MIAGHNLNIAVIVLGGIRPRIEQQRRAECGVDIAVLCIRRPLALLISQARFESLAPGGTDILEEAGADRRGDTLNVIFGIGPEYAGIPIENSAA
jgi:hypothetical protein